jgi:hypothetical protein
LQRPSTFLEGRFTGGDQTQPEPGLAGFFQGDAVFRDEVSLGLPGGGLFEICAHRTDSVNELESKPAKCRVVQGDRSSETHDVDCELK